MRSCAASVRKPRSCWSRKRRNRTDRGPPVTDNQSGRRGPYRQASPPPARHRPGARSARRPRCHFILPQTAGDFTMRLMKQSALHVELLEDRCLPSANVVLEWNQLALHAIGQARVNPVVASRALAITELAVYDSVVAIDGSF